jgi:hypothetical protein
MIEPKRAIGEGTWWILGFAVAVIVVVLIVSRFEAALGDVQKEADALNAAAIPAAMYAHANPQFERMHGSLITELRPLFRLRGAPSASVAAFLQEMHEEAARDRVVLDSMIGDDHPTAVKAKPLVSRVAAVPNRPVTAAPALPGPPSAPRRAALAARLPEVTSPIDEGFVELPYVLTMRGDYRDLLTAISRLPTGSVLARVEEVDLGPGPQTLTDGRLLAHVKLTIFHAVTDVESVGLPASGTIPRGTP